MKLNNLNRISLYAFSILFVLLLSSGNVFAQRFGHGGGGGGDRMGGGGGAPRNGGGGGERNAGGNGGGRPAPNPRAFNNTAPSRDFNPPRENPPAFRGAINGGSINRFHHDFNNRPNVVVSDHTSVRINNNFRDRDNINAYHRDRFGWGSGIHPYLYHPYHPYYWGENWHPFGYFLGALAVGAFAFTLANQHYYYNEGVYYEPYNQGYRVISAPYGAVINNLPDGYENIQVGDQYYYYFGGVFYIDAQGDGFQVVQAPYGAVVSQIPEGALEQNINGQNILVYNNTYYLPISQDGQDAYQVVQP